MERKQKERKGRRGKERKSTEEVSEEECREEEPINKRKEGNTEEIREDREEQRSV